MRKVTILCLVSLLSLNTGCSWLALLDTSEHPEEYECSERLHEITKKEAIMLDSQLSGSGKEKVIAIMGKPKSVKLEQYPYLADRECVGKNCITKLADEVWFYEFKKSLPCGRYAYSTIVYFIDEKVVGVR